MFIKWPLSDELFPLLHYGILKGAPVWLLRKIVVADPAVVRVSSSEAIQGSERMSIFFFVCSRVDDDPRSHRYFLDVVALLLECGADLEENSWTGGCDVPMNGFFHLLEEANRRPSLKSQLRKIISKTSGEGYFDLMAAEYAKWNRMGHFIDKATKK
jgi:hypothetical protein